MIALPLQLEQQINHIAEMEHIPVSNWVTQKLTEIVEDYQDIQAADKAKARLLTGESVRLSMDDAMRLLDELVD